MAMETEKRRKMDIFTEHIWAMILVRLPLKNIKTSILVCKQWKSLVESPYFYELFQTHHQNTNASWSLMFRNGSPNEVMAHYGCKIWGLPRSLCYYLSSFITTKFLYMEKRTRERNVRVLAYTDAGFILIYVASRNRKYYVANPVSRQCIKIPPCPLSLSSWLHERNFEEAGLVTRIENGVVLDYKVVLAQRGYTESKRLFTFIIYSSETGLWSSNILQYSIPLLRYLNSPHPICLNKDLHWLGRNLDGQRVVLSIDLYDSNHQYRVVPFPDSEKEPNIKSYCTPCQGSLMYMKIIDSHEDKNDVVVPQHKLSVWRLKTDEWQLVSEISLAFIHNGLDYFPLLLNPSDGITMYMWRGMNKPFASINLRNGKSTTVHNNEFELSRFGQKLMSPQCNDIMEILLRPDISMFVLPRWLYRIPGRPHSSMVAVSDPSPATLTRV